MSVVRTSVVSGPKSWERVQGGEPNQSTSCEPENAEGLSWPALLWWILCYHFQAPALFRCPFLPVWPPLARGIRRLAAWLPCRYASSVATSFGSGAPPYL